MNTNLTQEVLDRIFANVPDQLPKAVRCLQDHGRELEFPLIDRRQDRTRRTVQEIRACNLLDDVMSIPVADNGEFVHHKRAGRWASIRVTTSDFSGYVNSLDVMKYHKYVADGLVTCNSIYGFRGSEVGNILTLAKDRFCTRYELAANFRSTPMVCEAANRLIAHNQNRIPKMTVSMSHPDHIGSVTHIRLPDFASELRYLAKCIRIDLEIGRSIAVLLRYNVSVEEYAAALESYSIPISKLVSATPEDWPRLKLLVSFLANPDNDYLARQWLIMNVGQEEADQIALAALNEQKTINDMTGKLPAVIDRDMFSKIITASEISAASEQKLLTAMSHLETFSIQDILVEIHSGEHSQELGEGVTVTTMHSAKGREWDAVYLPAFEQGIIPGKRADEIEEDRRVAYVALTRAKMCVVITTVDKRKPLWGGFRPEPTRPSQFITEMGCEQPVEK